MIKLLEGFQPYREEDIKKYIDKRWWRGMTLGDIIDRGPRIREALHLVRRLVDDRIRIRDAAVNEHVEWQQPGPQQQLPPGQPGRMADAQDVFPEFAGIFAVARPDEAFAVLARPCRRRPSGWPRRPGL